LAPAPISQIQMLVSAEIPRVPRRPGELRRPHRRGSRTNGSSVCSSRGCMPGRVTTAKRD